MRFNPDKCAFGVQGGKFLGFILTSRGIEANPEKCNAVLSMTSQKTVKEVQQLAGRIATLSRFLPAMASRSYHFFQTFSKCKKFTWTDECENSFTKLKQLLASPPILQRPEADQPLRQILTRPELAGQLIKWSIELSEFDIQYESRKTLKSQVLADFVSEMTNETQHTVANWSIHVDGASNKEGSGAGVLLKEGEKVIAEQSLKFRFNASNNQAEYEALLAGLKLAQQLRIPQITVYCDSSLVVHQIKGEYQVPYWRTPFLNYINTGAIPNEEPNLPLFRRRASFYTVLGNTLYRHGHSQPLLKCISNEEAEDVMAEMHEGGLKKKLGEAKGEWADLIPEILWSYNTSIQSATGETPFKLVYGAAALIPVEVSVPTLRAELYNQMNNLQARAAELDLMEEERDISAIKQPARKQIIERRHNKRVVHRSFNKGDLVLRRTEEARKPPAHGKLAANWEGPF
ncbi:uncharacterized protein LOC107646404 [Arachis ipaensis]|uniref:uncharacterized protein LOC107646404 n=1 Tax=Arachis ipaensis TaxID=130454 RepID=UPI0007AF78E9|nr:uncharacterized protein LOC107646404 [Arachis ipaensis]